MKITGAIFDLDGTLLDSMFIWETVGEKYLTSIGIEHPEGMNKVFRFTSLLNAAKTVKERFCLNMTVPEIMENVNNYAKEIYVRDVKPKKGVIELLDKLKSRNVKMCIATATDLSPVTAVLRKNNMLHYFGEIFTEAIIGHGKREPYMFREAIKFLGTEKESTWIFEDALYSITTAKKEGFPVVGVYDKSEKNPEEVKKLSDIYIKDYSELNRILDN